MPNIVIVLADDLGYGDVGYLNSQSQIPTPNLDTLAGQGMAFLDAHSPSAICTPTRYGLLTGRYAWRTRLTRGVLDGYDGPLIAPNRETLGSFLGATGYRTAVIGKWHLGLGFAKNALGEFDFEEPIDDGPHTHGFDESYIIPASLDFPPYVYIRDGEITGFPLGQQSGMEFPRYMRAGELASDFDPADVLDELIRQATGFIQRQASDGSPFLLYLPLTARTSRSGRPSGSKERPNWARTGTSSYRSTQPWRRDERPGASRCRRQHAADFHLRQWVLHVPSGRASRHGPHR